MFLSPTHTVLCTFFRCAAGLTDDGDAINLSVFDDSDDLTRDWVSTGSSPRQQRAHPPPTPQSASKHVSFSPSIGPPQPHRRTDTSGAVHATAPRPRGSSASPLQQVSLASAANNTPLTSVDDSDEHRTNTTDPESGTAPRPRRAHPTPPKPTSSGPAPTPRRVIVSPRQTDLEAARGSEAGDDAEENEDGFNPYDTPQSIGWSTGAGGGRSGGGGGRGGGSGPGSRGITPRSERQSSKKNLLDAAQKIYESLQPAVETASASTDTPPSVPQRSRASLRGQPAPAPSTRDYGAGEPATYATPELANRRVSESTFF
jgi:hypothetical protein